MGKPLPLTLLPESRGRRRISGRSRDAPLRWRLLLPNGLACPRDEVANGQSSSGHHVFRSGVGPRRVTGLRGFLRSYLNRIHRFGLYGFTLNGLVSAFPKKLGCYFGRFVPYGRKFVRTGIPWAEVTGFPYNDAGGEEVRVPNIYVREEWAIYKERLVERLPSGVYRVYTENKVGSTKLPVPVNEDFRP